MIRVARMEKGDIDDAAAILFDAFGAVYRQRGHVPPFPTRDSAGWLCRAYLDLDPVGCAIARVGADAVGGGFAHPRGPVTGGGRLAARPKAPAVRQLRGDDLPAIERYDRARGGADRRPDFALLASSGSGFVVDGPDGGLGGFLFFRSLPARVVIGPGIAESAEIMADLVDA